jgi:hypothetical protein
MANQIGNGTDGKQSLIVDGGEAILRFDSSTVRRLVDHARSASAHMAGHDGPAAEPALLLVGDKGIYLMSNGLPRLLDDAPGSSESVNAGAAGCDPARDDGDGWRSVHRMIGEGDDFAIPIAIDQFVGPLLSCKSQIIILIDAETFLIVSDTEFDSSAIPDA